MSPSPVSNDIFKMIVSFVDDGMSNREILKKINAILKKREEATITNKVLTTIVDDIMDGNRGDESDTDKDDVSSACSDSSDEEVANVYITYSFGACDTENEDDDDETYVDEEDDESDEEDEYMDDSRIRQTARIYLNHSHGEYYDSINITPHADGGFEVTYNYDKACKHDKTHALNSFIGSGDAVIRYIRSIFKMLAIDQKPYSEIEFDIPFFPSISLTPADLLKKVKRRIVMDSLRDYCDEFSL